MLRLKVVTKQNRLPEIRVKLGRGLGDLTYDVAAKANDEAQRSFEGPKGGRVYRYRGRLHRASAPGHAPAILTGALANSMRPERISDKQAVVRVGAEHGVYLELGTRKMAPRPYLRPAAEKAAAWAKEQAYAFGRSL